MKFSNFFIERPVFATVISIVITLLGFLAIYVLPIDLYPDIIPPTVYVTGTYPGASAETVSNTVAAPLEDKINGVGNMLYMSSTNTSNGTFSLSIVFDTGTDINNAQIEVQNRVNTVLSSLPTEVQQSGISVTKQSPSFIMILSIQSPSGKYDPLYVSNFASLNVVSELKRVEGVANVTIIGSSQYSMRIWVKPDMMAELGITVSDIVNALKAQNSQHSIGALGSPPNIRFTHLTFPITTVGRLATVEEFENVVLRANTDGSFVRIKDIGRAEIGAQDYSVKGSLNGNPATLVAVYQQSGSNALQVANGVKDTMERISKDFPEGIEYKDIFDVTRFIKISIHDVVRTIFEAAILVMIVVFIFLQNWRATLIPIVAMIVSIIGTFAGMHILGFTINQLTLFGLILSIGIVVDDAIVVVENVERNIREKNLNSKEAALIAMQEVTGPVIAIVFVLCAVFIPVAILGGVAGQLYKQFAITITISVVISGIVALTLSPALAAILLKKHRAEGKFSLIFHKYFGKITTRYVYGTHWLLRRYVLGIAVFLILIAVVVFFYKKVPQSFVPAEDQGYFIIAAKLPDAASLDRTQQVTDIVVADTMKNPAVEEMIAMTGYSMLDGDNRTNGATYFPILKNWNERKSVSERIDHVIKELYINSYSKIEAGLVLPFNPPSIRGIGSVGGFEGWIVNRSEIGIQGLAKAAKDFVQKAKTRKELTGVTTRIEANSLLLFFDFDREKALAYGVDIDDVFQTLRGLYGSIYVNDFNRFGTTFEVIVQAEPAYRDTVHDIKNIFVRSSSKRKTDIPVDVIGSAAASNMVPLASLIEPKFSRGPLSINRFNGFPAASINGNAAPGYSSGDAIKAMEEVAAEVLPKNMVLSWSGLAYQQKKSVSSSAAILVGGIVMVFLILAALYEKWKLPLVIILSIPFGIFGAFLLVWLLNLSNDIYFQIGLVTLVALSAKNAILIVEFAIHKRKEGQSAQDAALTAARLRFRAIIMTSLTFIFGVLPLVLSQGAGAASRISVGTGVLGGMIAATCFGIFFVPLFYTLLERGKKQ